MVIVATAFPAPEHREEVITTLRRPREGPRRRGHLSSTPCTAGPDGRLVMIEKYASDDAVAAHRAGAGRPR